MPRSEEGVTQTEVDAYVDATDVTAPEAIDHLEVQEAGNSTDIAGVLEEALGMHFAGIWFNQDSGKFEIPVAPGADRGLIARELAQAKLAGEYRMTPVPRTWSELEAIQGEVDRSIFGGSGGEQVQTSIDSATNTVAITVGPEATQQERTTLKRLAGRYSGAVELRDGDSKRFAARPAACEPDRRTCGLPLRGGVAIFFSAYTFPVRWCTSAFRARGDTNGKKYLLTAGHCHEPQYPDWGTADENLITQKLGPTEQWIYPGRDWAKIHVSEPWANTGPWPARVVKWGNMAKTIVNENYPIIGEGNSYKGQFVCHSGRTTGTSCGVVEELNETLEYQGGEVLYGMTAMYGEDLCGSGGDSGGSVFAGERALGIFSGSTAGVTCAVWVWYSEITDATNALNAHIAYDSDLSVNPRVLNGQPGSVRIGGTVTAGGNPVGAGQVTVYVSKKENGDWVPNFYETVSLGSNGHYETSERSVGTGTWRATTAVPAMEWVEPSEKSTEFTVKDGYQIVSASSNKCLDVSNVDKSNGAAIQQWDCYSSLTSLNQVFQIKPLPGTTDVEIRARHSNRCLDVVNGSTANGAHLHQWHCSADPWQRWKVIGPLPGTVELRSVHSGKCLDLPSGNSANGVRVQQWDCNGAIQQKWKMQSVDSSPMKPAVTFQVDEILHGMPGFVNFTGKVHAGAYPIDKVNIVFERPDGSKPSGAQIYDLPVDGNGSFSRSYYGLGSGDWRVRAVFNSNSPYLETSYSDPNYSIRVKRGYRLINRYSSKCMTISEGKYNNGQAVIQWDCGAGGPGDGQLVRFVPVDPGVFNIEFLHPNESVHKCLDVLGAGTHNGAWTQIWGCNTTTGQQRWKKIAISGEPDRYALMPQHTGNKCADVTGPTMNNGARIQTWDCHWSNNQRWALHGVD